MASLREDMVADVTELLLDTDDFAENVDYRAKGKSVKTIKAVVQRPNDLDERAQQDGLVVVAEYRVFLASDATLGIAAPAHGDTIRLSEGVTIVVVGKENAAHGAYTLLCRKVSVAEKSGQNYRLTRT